MRHGSPGLGLDLRRAAAAAALALLVGCPPPATAQQPDAARDDAARRLEDSRRQLETARGKERAVADDLDALERERAALNRQLIDTARGIQDSEARLSRIEQRVGELTGEETRIRDSIVERHASIAKLLAAMQRLGGQPPPAIVTRRDDVLKMVRSAMLMAALYPELKGQADRLARDLDDLQRLRVELAEESERLRQEAGRLAGERARIAALMEERKKSMAARQHELAEIQQAAARHGRAVAELSDLVTRMDTEMAARMAKAEAERAAEAEREARRQAAARGEVELAPQAERVAFVSPGRIAPAIPFAKAKGSLRLPAQGAPTRAFGDSDGFGGSAKGMSLETRDSAQVTSPTDGWIVYADEFRGYGQLLIINAGEGYHVLLAGMRRIDVGLGQFVLAGEPVAVMGARAPAERQGDEHGRPVLYIEFRKDGQPVDPGPWWAESPEKVQG